MEQVTAASLPRIGTDWPEQGGIFAGTMLDGDQIVAIVAAKPGAYAEIKGPYGKYGETITGADSLKDGMANTLAMSGAGSSIATAVLATTIGGKSDWHIAAKHEASLVQINTPSAHPEGWIWTSTQGSAYDAWYQYSDGGQDWDSKDGEGAVLPVRRLSVIE